MFSAAQLFGYFLFMIVFMVIAIITAKRKISWVLYAIGVIWQYFSWSGLQREAADTGTDTIPYWITYGVLLVLAAVLIILKKKKAKE